MVAAIEDPRRRHQQPRRGNEEIVAPVRPVVGDRAALHVLAPIGRPDGNARLVVLVVEVAGVEHVHPQILRIAGGVPRQHHRARRAAIIVVADMDDEVGAVARALD
jgi:hypothetical protein